MGHGKAYRPQLARCSLQQRIIHRKRQPEIFCYLAFRQKLNSKLETAVQVCRMYGRSLPCYACLQSCHCLMLCNLASYWSSCP